MNATATSTRTPPQKELVLPVFDMNIPIQRLTAIVLGGGARGMVERAHLFRAIELGLPFQIVRPQAAPPLFRAVEE